MLGHLLKKSQSGMSLVEVMVVVTIMGLITVGTATLMKNMYELQSKTRSRVGLLEFKENFEETLRRSEHWTATVNHPSNNSIPQLTCLRENTPDCTNGSSSTIQPNIFQFGNNIFYQGRDNRLGIDKNGTLCDRYPRKLCPFRYDLTIRISCQSGQATCSQPQVRITGDFHTGGTLSGRPEILKIAEDPTYRIELRRGERETYEPFELVQYSTTGTNPPGGGDCTPGNWRRRTFTDKLSDVGGNVRFAGPNRRRFIAQPGTYECTVSAEGYDQPSGFKIRLFNESSGASFPVGSARTASGSSTTVIGKVQFAISGESTFSVQHYCTNQGADPWLTQVSMGRPIPQYSDQTIFTRVYCVRTN